METQSKFQIRAAKKSDHRSIVNLLSTTFCDTEPTTTALGITEDEYRPFAEHAVANCIASGLSFVAVDGEEEVIAAALAEDWALRGVVPSEAIAPSMAPLVSLLESLHESFQPGEIDANVVAYGWITAVKPSFQGAGLGPRINGAALKNMRTQGFRYSYAEFTNPQNALFAAALPAPRLRHVAAIPYDTFEFEGGCPFSQIEGGASSYLFAFADDFDLEKVT